MASSDFAEFQLGGEVATAAMTPEEFSAHFYRCRFFPARLNGQRVYVNPRAVRCVVWSSRAVKSDG